MAEKSKLYRNAYHYRGTHAMPGSQLHKLLDEGKEKEAAQHFKEGEEKQRLLMEQAERLSTK